MKTEKEIKEITSEFVMLNAYYQDLRKESEKHGLILPHKIIMNGHEIINVEQILHSNKIDTNKIWFKYKKAYEEFLKRSYQEYEDKLYGLCKRCSKKVLSK